MSAMHDSRTRLGLLTRLGRLYGLVPLTSVVLLVVCLVLPSIGRFRWIAVGFCAYTVSHAWRAPASSIATSLDLSDKWSTVASVVLPVVAQELLRLSGLYLVLPFPNPGIRLALFHTAWSYATGFAIASELYGVTDVYSNLALYDGVESSITLGDDEEIYRDDLEGGHDLVATTSTLTPELSRQRSSSSGENDSRVESPRDYLGNPLMEPVLSLDDELNQLVAARKRVQLEEVLGMAFPNIPVMVLCLQRLDAVLFNLGATLIIAAQYTLQDPVGPGGIPFRIIATLGITIPLSVSVNIVWSRLLARLGIHVVAYGTLFLSLAMFLSGLACWGIVS